MQNPKPTTILIAALLAVIAVLLGALIFVTADRPARPTESVNQTTAPAATLPETAPDQSVPAATESAPTEPPQSPPAQPVSVPQAEITDPDFYAQESFWPDGTFQQKVERTSDTITVSLFNMEGLEYRRAMIYLTADGGYAYKETTLFDEKGKPVEFRVTTAEGLTTAMTTWEYEYDEKDRLIYSVCHMTSDETSCTEDRFTYFADGSCEWEHKAYRREKGEEILWNHFIETSNASGAPLSRETLVENGTPA